MEECLQRLVGLKAHQLGLSRLFEAGIPVTEADIDFYDSYTA